MSFHILTSYRHKCRQHVISCYVSPLLYVRSIMLAAKRRWKPLNKPPKTLHTLRPITPCFPRALLSDRMTQRAYAHLVFRL